MSETCRGETTERTWFHCYALWLYTGQVESLSSSSENNLFPQKNWHVLYFVIALHQEKGLQMNEDTVATWHQLWYSHFLWARSSDKAEQENTLTKSRLIVGLRPSPPAWHPPHLRSTTRSRSVFFDDRQWQSRAELYGSCLSSGCSVWCAFDVVQAHRRAPSLTVGPWHQTQTELKSGGEEGRKHTSKTDSSERKEKNNIQSSLSHCLYIVT